MTCVHMMSHPGRLIHPERQISADGKWKEMRVHQEERKGRDSELELICKGDLQGSWSSISAHSQGCKVKLGYSLNHKTCIRFVCFSDLKLFKASSTELLILTAQ